MDVTLTADEAALVARVLQERIGDYHMQIADADSSEFKAKLRSEVALLEAVAQRVRAGT